jgi:putative methyltransferase (TIGR04325 family)
MNLQLKHTIKSWMPPILVDLARRLLTAIRQERPEWEYVPEGWARAQADARIRGWNVESVLGAYLAKWPTFVHQLESTAPLGTSPESPALEQSDLAFHNAVMIFAYALALASRAKNAVSMLDWGGGIGHYYLIGQTLVPGLEIDYHCKDTPVLIEHGKKLFPQAHFYADDSCLARRYDFVLASTSLHYSEDWPTVLAGLAGATDGFLLVTQLPVTFKSRSFVFVQRPYRYGYNTEYLGWCLNQTEFLARAQSAGLELLREFLIGHQIPIARAPAPCEYRAFLFRPRTSHVHRH